MGLLVCVAGIDGAGKTTAVTNVVHWLAARGIRAHGAKLPLVSNPAFLRYKNILRWVKTEAPDDERELRAALITLETCRWVHEEIAPALEDNEIVVCDRFIEGAHSYLRARGLPSRILDVVRETFPAPDMNFLLDVSLEESTRRRAALGELTGNEQAAFLRRVGDLLDDWARVSGATRLDAVRPAAELAAAIGEAALRVWAARRGERNTYPQVPQQP